MSSPRKTLPLRYRRRMAFVAPYLTLLAEDVSQRKYPLRDLFNRLRHIVKTGAH